MILTLKTIKDRCVEVGACWIWQQGLNSGGAPQARNGKDSVIVRRHAWALKNGRAARSRYFVVSTCLHTLCVAPDCALELSGRQYIGFRNANGTLNNAAHQAARTRSVRARSKLTLERAADVRCRIHAGEDRGAVAALHGITRHHANRVARGGNWKAEAFSVFNQAA